jgi:hypothetical protein
MSEINEVEGQLRDSQVVIDPREIASRLRSGAMANEVTASTVVYGDLTTEEK